MNKPKILLSGKVNLQFYVDAVNGLGAEADAKYLPPIDTNYDGLILCGGSDVDPQYYGQAINGSVNLDKERDAVEFALLEAYVKAGKPVMGICRGYQLINIFFGGSLEQHIEAADLHVRHNGVDSAHTVTAEKGSILQKLYGDTFSVNSSHHQAVMTLGSGLRATAFWNNLTEAYEHDSLPIFGVQWHPERMCFTQKREDTVDGSLLIRYFLEQMVKKTGA